MTNSTVKTIPGSGTDPDIAVEDLGGSVYASQVVLVDGTRTKLGTATNALRTDPTGSTTQPVSGTVTVTPSGTQDVNVTKVGGSAVTLGLKASASSVPVVIASDQGTLNVAQVGAIQIQDSSGNNIDTDGAGHLQIVGPLAGLDINVRDSTGTGISSTSGHLDVNVSNTITANLGTISTAATAANQTSGNTTLTTISTSALNLRPGTAGALSKPSVTTSSTALAAADNTRKGTTIYNTDAGIPLYVAFGFTATTTNYSLIVQPGGYVEVPSFATQLALNGVTASGTITANVTAIT